MGEPRRGKKEGKRVERAGWGEKSGEGGEVETEEGRKCRRIWKGGGR